MQAPQISTGRRLRDELESQGFAYFRGTDLGVPPQMQRELELLQRDYEALSPDPYCEGGNRYRRHSRFVLLPWLSLLEVRPVSHYLQDRHFNPDDGGVVRTFERLTAAMESNAFLRGMIFFDFANAGFDESIGSTPVDVGVHAIRCVARPSLPGISSPDRLHKDGEPFTFIHLIARDRVTGGESLVTDNDKRPLTRVTLSEPLDTVTVSDRDVYHQVEPIEVAAGESEGYRDVLLIDFTPMHPAILGVPESS